MNDSIIDNVEKIGMCLAYQKYMDACKDVPMGFNEWREWVKEQAPEALQQ